MKTLNKLISVLVLSSLVLIVPVFADNAYDSADKVSYSVTMNYPFFLNYPTLHTAITKAANNEANSFAKTFSKLKFDDLTRADRSYSLVVDSVFAYDSKEYASVILSSCTVTGGAAGTTKFIPINYDKASQKVINLKTFIVNKFGKDKMKSVLKRMSEKSRELLAARAQELGITYDEKKFNKATEASVKAFANFGVTDTGIVIQFDLNTVFPVADGAPCIEIPLAAL